MRNGILIGIMAILAAPQTPPPDTEVFIAPLTTAGGRLSVGKPQNISNSPGYDNQPSFADGGRSVLFTSARGGPPSGAAEPQMDIYKYEIDSGRVTRVTNTPESEYSATVTPDGKHISVIRVEADKSQRLWQFTATGSDPTVVLADVKPVGYHAWLDDHTLALFVLGQPATLQIADTRTGSAVIAARDIGRSLQPIPGGGVSFVQRAGDGPQRSLTISEVRIKDGQPIVTTLTAAAPGATEEYVAWTADGTLLMAAAGSLRAWKRGDAVWNDVADLAALGIRSVSRLAVSPRGDWLALVGQSAK